MEPESCNAATLVALSAHWSPFLPQCCLWNMLGPLLLSVVVSKIASSKALTKGPL